MTNAEEYLMNLGVLLCEGLQDMIVGGRLKLADIPEDDVWLDSLLREMANARQQVKITIDHF